MADTSIPVQELPPWLTYSYATYTNGAGSLTTATTILQLPLTYYGPSIPLGPDWTYGGLTSPASTSTNPPTTAQTTVTSPTTATPEPSITPTATPSTITSAPTPTSTSTSSSLSTTNSPSSLSSSASSSTPPSSSSTLSSSSSTLSSSSSTPSSSSTLSSSSVLPTTTLVNATDPGGLSGRQITAIVLGIVAFVLLLAILATCIILRRRRVRRSTLGRSGDTWKDFAPVLGPSRTRSTTNTFSSFVDISSSMRRGTRPLGEGSPRHSGEEADPLLRPSHGGGPQMTQRGPPAAVWAVSADGQHVFLRHSRSTKSAGDMDGGDSSEPFTDELGAIARAQRDISHHPGYGTPKLGDEESPLLPPRALDPDGLGILPSRTHDSGVEVDPAMVPPRLVPSTSARRVQISEQGVIHGPSSSSDALPSSESDRAQYPDIEKGAVAFPTTPTREAAEPSTPHPTPATPTPRPGWLPNLGLARFSQLSWLNRVPSSPALGSTPRASSSIRSRRSRSRSRSRPASGGAWAALAGEDGEEPILGGTPPLRIRTRSGLLAAPLTAERPRSTVSGKSAVSSMYHSARESPIGSQNSRGTGNEQVPPVPALPAAVAQSGGLRQGRTPSPLMQHPGTPPPQAEQQPPVQQMSLSPPPAPFGQQQHHRAMLDILDLPAPSANTTFSSSASSSRPRPTLLAIPPGLGPLPAFPTPTVWADVGSSSGSASPSSLGEMLGSGNRYSTVGDVLDADPPRPGEVWRSLTDARDRGRAANVSVPTFVHQPQHRDSLLASVHASSSSSLHAHFIHSSARAGGALPLSLSPFGSPAASSRSHPSQHPSQQSQSSRGAQSSLAHSRSVSEDGRRRAPGTRFQAGEVDDTPLSAAPSLTAFGITAPGFAGSPQSSLGQAQVRRSGTNPFMERIAARAAMSDSEASGMYS